MPKLSPEAVYLIVVLLWIFAVLICDLRARIIGWFSCGAIVGFLGCLAYAVRSTSFISILGIGVFCLVIASLALLAELQNKEAHKALVDSADELKTRLIALEKTKAESDRTYDDQVNGLRSKLKKEVAAHATTKHAFLSRARGSIVGLPFMKVRDYIDFLFGMAGTFATEHDADSFVLLAFFRDSTGGLRWQATSYQELAKANERTLAIDPEREQRRERVRDVDRGWEGHEMEPPSQGFGSSV